MKQILPILALCGAILVPGLAVAQDHHDDRGYYDKHHKDYHQWNDHEDRAWHMYWEQHHKHAVDWQSANERQRQDYWKWRHNHSDSLLKIDIR